MNHLKPTGLPKPLLDFAPGAAIWSPLCGLCFVSYTSRLVVVSVATENRVELPPWAMFQEVECSLCQPGPLKK